MYLHQCAKCEKQFTTETQVNRVKCPYCGEEMNVAYAQQQPPQQPLSDTHSVGQDFGNVFEAGPSGKSRGVAGLLALLVGALGVHYFYMGKTTPGVIFLLATLCSCFILSPLIGIVAIIQGVLFFTMTEEEFRSKWVNTNNSFPVF